MGKMSRNKGKRGELEVAALMRKYRFEARRGQQHRGGADSPDVIHSLPGTHVEVKFRENFSLYEALAKADEEKFQQDRSVVFHRRVRRPWLVTMDAEDFLSLIEDMESLRDD